MHARIGRALRLDNSGCGISDSGEMIAQVRRGANVANHWKSQLATVATARERLRSADPRARAAYRASMVTIGLELS
jgi:hypothetical protein